MTGGDDRFIKLYERFHAPVYAYCRRRTSVDTVDDVVADTFLVAWKKINEVPEDSRTLPWLYGVAYRVLSHQHRGASRRQKLRRKLSGLEPISTLTPDEVVVAKQESSLIIDALSDLKPSDQEMLRMTAWEGLAPKDIATALGIGAGAARQRLHEARKNLAKSLARIEQQGGAAAMDRGVAR